MAALTDGDGGESDEKLNVLMMMLEMLLEDVLVPASTALQPGPVSLRSAWSGSIFQNLR